MGNAWFRNLHIGAKTNSVILHKTVNKRTWNKNKIIGQYFYVTYAVKQCVTKSIRYTFSLSIIFLLN